MGDFSRFLAFNLLFRYNFYPFKHLLQPQFCFNIGEIVVMNNFFLSKREVCRICLSLVFEL